jgi:hypothetical protein
LNDQLDNDADGYGKSCLAEMIILEEFGVGQGANSYES